MSENLKTDASDVNKFILDAVREKKPIFGAFKTLCEIQKDQKLDYVNFEWKYYQFYHGNQGPNSSSPVTFSDLPMDVLGKVVGKLNLVDCLVLRKVCYDLRSLIDSSELYCENIYINFDDRCTRILLDSDLMDYEQADDGGCHVTSNFFWDEKINFWDERRYKDVRNAQQVMLANVSTFLSNPKLKIGKMDFHGSIQFEEDHLPGFLEFLKSLNFQLNVRSTTHRKKGLSIIQFLKPGRLEGIKLFANTLSHDEFNEIAETEQWKMAKNLEWNLFPNEFGIERLRHFEKIKIGQFDFSEENLTMLRDILLESPRLQSCCLEKETNPNDHRYDANERVVRVLNLPLPLNPEALQFQYNDSFHLKMREYLRELYLLTFDRISEN